MRIPSNRNLAVAILLLACLPAAAAPKSPVKAWTDPAAALREDPDFAIQGEYEEATAGAQLPAVGSNVTLRLRPHILPAAKAGKANPSSSIPVPEKVQQ